MLKIGLTGGIGSGKTLVASVFSKLGIHVYISDEKAKALMNTNAELKRELIFAFGDSIYIDGMLNKKKLSSIIFKNDQHLTRVNRIVHPFVRQDFSDWCILNNEHKYVINESAIVFNSGLDKELDKIISVIAPLETRIKRVMQRDNITEEDVRTIAAKQPSARELVTKSDYILQNDETELLLPQIISLHQTILALN